MERINLEGGIKVPKLQCDAQTGVILIEGVSVPENTVDFYHPVVFWMQEYVKNPQEMTVFNLRLEYFNTSTSVILLNMFRVLSPLGPKKLTINWFFEEDDIEMEEAGEDYSNMIDAIFNIIKVDSF
jgi:hypothetical protein